MEFVVGANLPWFDYGLDFGANAWRPAGGIGRPDAREGVSRNLAMLARAGVQAVRWFLFCDGRAGIRFDQRGQPAGLDDFVLRDIDAALDLASREGLGVMFVLLDFHWCHPRRVIDGVQVGGRGPILSDPDAAANLLEFVVRPVVERYASEPAILAWDIFNEPEWVEPDRLRRLLSDAIATIRSCSTRPVTIGSAGARWRSWYRGLDVDYYQVHWYDALEKQPPLETPVDVLGFDRPVLLGEFPTRGSRRTPEDIVATARSAGYAGAFYWSALSNDACSDPSWTPACPTA